MGERVAPVRRHGATPAIHPEEPLAIHPEEPLDTHPGEPWPAPGDSLPGSRQLPMTVRPLSSNRPPSPPSSPMASDSAPSLRDRFLAAPDFPAYLETVEKNRELWHGLHERARVPEDLVERGRELPGRWHLLALTEDWCGDAVNVLPVVARWVESLPDVQLRLLGRDDNPDLMDAHLTNGRSRSIPVVIVYDEEFREVGWWGPRPGPLQEWVLSEGLTLSSADRYREVRRWYVRDRGRTTLAEILALIETSAAVSGSSR